MEFNLEKYKKVHFIGIKGAGMAALAGVLLKNGFLISGSDVSEDFATTKKSLDALGASVSLFGKEDFSEVDAVVISNAYNTENNIDAKKAEEKSIPIFYYSDVVASFFNNTHGVAVAGSHGKTTVSAMLADILKKTNKNTTAIVGSVVNEWGTGMLSGSLKEKDALFVLEADEYKRVFLKYKPEAAIITSIDYDHPDCYETKEDYEDAFMKFAKDIADDGFLVANEDYPEVVKVTKSLKCKIIFYGKNNLEDFKLRVPGKYNIYNANAAYLAALELGVSEGDAKKYIEEFSGTARRFEIIGVKNKATIVDDYAHHPAEVNATLSGAKKMFPDKKIIAIFQPHTYSRTKKFSAAFSESFEHADEVVLTDVYSSARELIDSSVNIKDISDKIGNKSVYIKEKNDILEYCKQYLEEDSLIIFMGAGDLWELARDLCEK